MSDHRKGFPCLPAMPLPRRVRSAFKAWTMLVQTENGIFTADGTNIMPARALDKFEQRLKAACMETMSNFITGESEIDDTPAVNIMIPTEQIEAAIMNLQQQSIAEHGVVPKNLSDAFASLKESLRDDPTD